MVKKPSKGKVLLVAFACLFAIGYITNKVEVADDEPFRQQLIDPAVGFPTETTVDKRFVRWSCADEQNRPKQCGTRKTGYAEQRVLRASVAVMGCTVHLDRLPSSEVDYAFREMYDTNNRRIDVTAAPQPFARLNPTHAQVKAYIIAVKDVRKLRCFNEQ